MSQVTIISGVERRRAWSDEQKLAILTEAFAPGANVADVARRADLRPSSIYRWRRQMRAGAVSTGGFAPVLVSPDRADAVPGPTASSPALIIELRGMTVRIAGDAPPGLVATALRALRR
jgi:transposase